MTRQRLPRAILIGLSLTLALGACAEIEELSLCRQWDDLQVVAAEIQALDPSTATGDDVVDLVDEARTELDQFWHSAEGYYERAISDLRAAMVDLRQAAYAVGEGTLEVSRPLLEESWDDTQTRYQLLAQRLDVVCDSG